jgi:hypothetical protein
LRAIVSKLGVPAVLYVVPSPRLPLLVEPYEVAVGVGSNPDSSSKMWGTHVVSGDDDGPRIETELSKCPDNPRQPVRFEAKESERILRQCPRGAR